MQIYFFFIILISLSAGFAYINQRFIKLPFVIGIFLLSTLFSIFLIVFHSYLGFQVEEMKVMLHNLHLDKFVLNILLGFLLFAGALHSDWFHIKKYIRIISSYAIFGVLASTVIIAVMLYFVSGWFGIQIPMIYCFIFGALISPTDPIAVIGILKQAKVPIKTESIITGESLFNDGVGVVTFIALLDALNTGSFSFSHFGILFIQEAIGGIIWGLILGFILYLLLKSIDHYQTEVLLTLAFVLLGYQLAGTFHISGALSMVVMGLMVRNFRPNVSMSDQTEEYVEKFWELMDVILNAILFILIAFVIIVVDFFPIYIYIALISVFIVIFSRFLVVFLPLNFFPKTIGISRKDAQIITWGGLRGGLSLALVLSLPESKYKHVLLICTYFTVLFSILIQGLTIGKVAQENQGNQ